MDGLVLLSGATGNVGGRLLSRFEASGIRVRCLTRRPETLRARHPRNTEILAGDVLKPESLTTAFQGVHTAYYLIHSMGDDRDFELQDRIAAENFAKAAAAAGVHQLVYLGGLGNPDDQLSKHLRSRQVNEDGDFAETRWSDAASASGRPQAWGGDRLGSRLVDSRSVHVEAPPALAFTPIRRIGGDTGWYYGNWLWSTRGFLDLLVGGVGVHRGRRDPEELRDGDALDFWRVEIYEPPHRLRLRAEMKLPGRAWLEFEVVPTEKGSTIRQTAMFDPRELAGLVYWYGIYPLHQFVFAGMLRNIARRATDIAPL